MVVEAKLRSPIHSTFDALVVLPQPVGGRKCFSWFLFWLIKMCLGLVKMTSNSGSESEITFAPTKYFCFTGYIKTFDCVDHNKLWKILREMGIPDHLTCLLQNLYAGQEATVRTRHGKMNWFKIWKGVHQGCILSP